jgi:hypothetical protein
VELEPSSREPVAEALPVVEPESAAEPAPAPAPEPEPTPAALVSALEPEVVAPAEPESPEPEPGHPAEAPGEAQAPQPEFVPMESAPLPDFVIDAPDEPAPVVVPEPEPEPELGPLPDYVVDTPAESQPPFAPEPPASPLAPEDEEDLGPLPEYVIDPSRPPELKPSAPPRAVVKPLVPLELTRDSSVDEASRAGAVGLYFPPVTAFPAPRQDHDDDPDSPRESRRAPRRRPPVEPGTGTRSSEPAEPGDEATEASWMRGLSNRLSAYSLSDEELAGEGDDTASADESTGAES